MKLFGVACAVAVAAALAGNASAEPAPIAIEYLAPAGCADESSVRVGVIARLGHDPFRGDAPRRVLIDVTEGATGFIAAIQLHEPGKPQPSRRAVGPSVACEDTIAALELVLAVLIDPDHGSAAPGPPSQPPKTFSDLVAPTPQRPGYEPPGWRAAAAAASVPKRPPRYELAISIGSLAGAMPKTTLTFGLRAGYAITEHLRAGIHARGGSDRGELDAQRTYDVGVGELHAEVCSRWWLAIVCGVIGFGSKSVSIERDDGMFVVTDVADYSSQYFLAGGSISFDIPLGRGIIRPTVNAIVPLPPVQIESEGMRRAELPIAHMGFDLALGFRW
ncbi:MAG: hypothetical protein H0T46_10075 [Deltaproteobacteria bacterium]|nr:hypothetical protein [Deltaproteobacteria bacterium]